MRLSATLGIIQKGFLSRAHALRSATQNKKGAEYYKDGYPARPESERR